MTQKIVVVSGNPRAGSRTSTLAAQLGAALTDAPVIIEVGALGAGLLIPDDGPTAAALAEVRDADVLVVATPTYKGTFTGVLKVLLDQLPHQALAGKRAIPVVTAGIAPQAAAAEQALSRLLAELGADVAPGLPVIEADLPNAEEIIAKYVAGFAGS